MTELAVLLFTRYPVPGRTKTRLVPKLGADGAALAQQAMTEQVLAEARRFVDSGPGRRLEIFFTGAGIREMGLWLGFSWCFRPQTEGDLGLRLWRAIGAPRPGPNPAVIVIGSDCPALSAVYLEEAAAALARGFDLVVGPAWDGGYCLLGLRRGEAALFQGIDWGGATVLRQTLEVAARLGWRVRELTPLPDIDRPEDLELWRGLAKPLLSVVIPVLNESASLPATLAALGLERFGGTVEVIVVDGGSHDDSAALAAAAGCRVLVCRPSGRGRQMNLGAAAARGRYLLFLHADTRIPDNAFIKICRSLARPGVALGAFSLALDEPGVRFRLLEKLVHWRSRFWGLPYGDQGFFVRAETFAGVGGFWSEGLLEDVDFLRRIKPTGRLVLLPEKILTSARRWRRNGFWRVTLVNQMILLGYWLGVPPHVLFRFYYGGVSGGD